jgi:hypothetical protein
VPQTCTVRGEQPLNLLMYLLRDEIGWAGHTEVLTHGLCSIHDNFMLADNTHVIMDTIVGAKCAEDQWEA